MMMKMMKHYLLLTFAFVEVDVVMHFDSFEFGILNDLQDELVE